MKRICLVALWVVVWAAGVVQAQEPTEAPRNWGFGWDSGLTLRRQLGAWQVGVTAGPDDYLSDTSTRLFDVDWPDSIQGIVSTEDEYHRESGYVRLHATRMLASQRTLALRGLVGGSYRWADESWAHQYYQVAEEDWRKTAIDRFTKTWQLRLGARVVWYPVRFLSLESEFGLQYEWATHVRNAGDRQADETEWSVGRESGRRHSFSQYGAFDLLYNLQVIIWL